MKTAIGFIGIGRMGTLMADRLARASYPVVAYDLSKEGRDRARQLGAVVASSCSEVAEKAEVVITMLPDSTSVESAVYGPQGLSQNLKKGQTLIDMSSCHPASTVAISHRLANLGVSMLDAPVSGGVAGAKAGTLSVMVGGDIQIFEQCRPILEAMGSKIFHVGPTGTGHAMKAINNFLSSAALCATSEALVLAMKAGIAPETAVEVLNSSTGRSYATEYKIPRFVLNRAFNSGFPIGLMHKDLDITMRMAKEKGVPVFVASTVNQIFSYAMSQGWQEDCHTAIVKCMEDWCGVEIRSAHPDPSKINSS